METTVANKTVFHTSIDFINKRIGDIEPIAYGSSRNFIDGAVTYLSPYISRGVISTKQVMEAILKRGYKPHRIEKFLQELAWRDYWQHVWKVKGDVINADLKRPQPDASNFGIPAAVTAAKTGIEALDSATTHFYETGYLHNHVRMYIASICCNVAKCHWSQPAKWMYYHLLDGDWASNALSWQWVAGSNSSKKYYANQGNINKFCYSKQRRTFLDVSYEELSKMGIPDELTKLTPFSLKTSLPKSDVLTIDPALPTLIYNFYNLDPNWKSEKKANRILLLEPSHFEKYPVSEKSIAFILKLSKNIDGAQLFVGEFQDLISKHITGQVFFKEHPANNHYQGIQEERDWMFTVTGYFPSFFAFWKKCKKELK
ncbi:MAG: FAD-binding domain-containing protein [Bacteroidota bacterium]